MLPCQSTQSPYPLKCVHACPHATLLERAGHTYNATHQPTDPSHQAHLHGPSQQAHVHSPPGTCSRHHQCIYIQPLMHITTYEHLQPSHTSTSVCPNTHAHTHAGAPATHTHTQTHACTHVHTHTHAHQGSDTSYPYTCMHIHTMYTHVSLYTCVFASKYRPGPVSEHDDVPTRNVELVGVPPAGRVAEGR